MNPQPPCFEATKLTTKPPPPHGQGKNYGHHENFQLIQQIQQILSIGQSDL